MQNSEALTTGVLSLIAAQIPYPLSSGRSDTTAVFVFVTLNTALAIIYHQTQKGAEGKACSEIEQFAEAASSSILTRPRRIRQQVLE